MGSRSSEFRVRRSGVRTSARDTLSRSNSKRTLFVNLQKVNQLSGDRSWNPVGGYQMCFCRLFILQLVGLIIWIIGCIVVTLALLLIFPNDGGIKGYEWAPIVGCVIAILFGIFLLLCCKINADKLSWRKRLLMYSALEDLEQVNLRDTALGIRPGKEGAWIELGNKASIGSPLNLSRQVQTKLHTCAR